jgi:hypothetical protein
MTSTELPPGSEVALPSDWSTGPGDWEDDRADRPSLVWAALAVVLAFATGVAASYGIAEGDKLWVIGAALVFAPALVVSAHGAARVQASPRAAVGATVAGLVLVFVIAIVVSTPWWSDDGAGTAQFSIPSNDPAAYVYVHAQPGGPELTEGRGRSARLVGGREYAFDCQVRLPDSTYWARLADSSYWVPMTGLRAPDGRAPTPGSLPTC